MDAQSNNMIELAASLVASPTQGVRAAFNMRTSDREVALAFLKAFHGGAVLAGVIGVSAVAMLPWWSSRQQSAELALVEDEGGRPAADS